MVTLKPDSAIQIPAHKMHLFSNKLSIHQLVLTVTSKIEIRIAHSRHELLMNFIHSEFLFLLAQKSESL